MVVTEHGPQENSQTRSRVTWLLGITEASRRHRSVLLLGRSLLLGLLRWSAVLAWRGRTAVLGRRLRRVRGWTSGGGRLRTIACAERSPLILVGT